jgi:hypothetical protein
MPAFFINGISDISKILGAFSALGIGFVIAPRLARQSSYGLK